MTPFRGSGNRRRRAGVSHVRVIACAAWFALIVSCASPPTQTGPKADASIAAAGTHADRQTGLLDTADAAIDRGDAAGAKAAVKASVAEEKAYAKASVDALKSIRADAARVEAENAGLKETIVKLRSDERRAARRAFLLMVALGGVGFALGLAGIFFGAGKLAQFGAVASFSVMVVGMVVTEFYDWIIWGALGGAALLVAGIVLIIIRERRAVVELVRTGEASKQKLDDMARGHIFTGADAVASKIQSAQTRALVAQVRRRLGFAGSSMAG